MYSPGHADLATTVFQLALFVHSDAANLPH